MTRLYHTGAFLVVEGVSDVRFWKTRKHVACELVDGEGKANVVRAIHRLDAENVCGVLGVVDDDYDGLMGISHGTPNVVATDAHDLECLLCRSSALEAVLAEFGIDSKIRQFEEAAGVDVRTGLLDRAVVFGRLRWAAMRRDLKVNIDAIGVPQFVDRKTWRVDGEQLARAVVDGETLDNYEVLMRSVAELPGTDPWYVARGHDMVQILRIGLQRVLGAMPTSTGTKVITMVLRSAMSLGELESTKLCADMRTWERANGYSVLRN